MKKNVIVSGIVAKTAKGEKVNARMGILQLENDHPVTINFRTETDEIDINEDVIIDISSSSQYAGLDLSKFKKIASSDGVQYFGNTLTDNLDMSVLMEGSYPLLPSVEVLGYGIPVGATYSVENVKNLIYDFTDVPTHEVQFNSKTYMCPEGITATSTSETEGEATYQSSREEVTELFNSKGSLKGSMGGFNAEFSADFSSCNENSTEFNYSIYDMERHIGFINIKDDSNIDYLAKGIKQSSIYQDLPDTFTPENAQLWYSFFQIYGTQFISKVYLGGSLYYYAYISKSYNLSSEKTKLACKMSYECLFYSTEAEASAEWEKVDKIWTENSKTKAISRGGKAFAIPNTDCGANYHNKFEDWLDSLADNPYPVSFEIAGINNIFSGQQAAACRSAMISYTNKQLLVNTTFCDLNDAKNQILPSIQLQGTTLPSNKIEISVTSVTNTGAGDLNPSIEFNGKMVPPPVFTDRNNYWFVVINPDTMSVVESIVFNVPDEITDQLDNPTIHHIISEVLNPHVNGRNILVVATKAVDAFHLPQGEFYDFLLLCGGGSELKKMESHAGDSNTYVYWNYSLTGSMGANVQMVERATSVNFQTKTPVATTMPPYYSPTNNTENYLFTFNNFRAVVINNNNVQVELDVSFPSRPMLGNPNYFTEYIKPLFLEFMSTDYSLVFTTYNLSSFTIPQGDFYDFLMDCGAGDQLKFMESQIGNSNQMVGWRYALVGLMKSSANTGYEISGYCDSSQTTNRKPVILDLPSIVMIPNYYNSENYGFIPELQ